MKNDRAKEAALVRPITSLYLIIIAYLKDNQELTTVSVHGSCMIAIAEVNSFAIADSNSINQFNATNEN